MSTRRLCLGFGSTQQSSMQRSRQRNTRVCVCVPPLMLLLLHKPREGICRPGGKSYTCPYSYTILRLRPSELYAGLGLAARRRLACGVPSEPPRPAASAAADNPFPLSRSSKPGVPFIERRRRLQKHASIFLERDFHQARVATTAPADSSTSCRLPPWST